MTHTEMEVKKVEIPRRTGTFSITLMVIAMALFLGFIVWGAKSVDPSPPAALTQTEPAPTPPTP